MEMRLFRRALSALMALMLILLPCMGMAEESEKREVLPISLESIEDRAFEKAAIQNVVLKNGCKTIGERAFASSKLKMIVLPASIEYIAETAFDGCEIGVYAWVNRDSYAQAWCKRKGLTYRLIEEPLQGFRVGIDPGHQFLHDAKREQFRPWRTGNKARVSAGTARGGVKECEVNLAVGLELRRQLEELGCEVVMSHDTNEGPVISNYERAQIMNEANVDLWFRLHCNGVQQSSRNGIMLYVSTGGVGMYDGLYYGAPEESYRLAQIIMETMGDATTLAKGSIKQVDKYTGNNWSLSPCVLVEMGYFTNGGDFKYLTDPEGQVNIARGLTKGIVQYFDRDYLGDL